MNMNIKFTELKSPPGLCWPLVGRGGAGPWGFRPKALLLVDHDKPGVLAVA